MGKWHKGWWAAAGITAVLGKIISDQRQAQQTSRHIFKGKVAIVTGGASGIGQALCAGLARRGAQVVVADINEVGANTVAQAINVSGGQARPAVLDVTDKEAVTQLVQGVAETYGRLDYIFNNAGIGISGYLQDIGQEAWEEIVNINLWGVIYGTQAAYEIMLRQGHGHIVNTASLAGLIPMPSAVPYAVVKHGVVGLSTSLRDEAQGRGIKVSVICPGFINTPIYSRMDYHSRNKEKVLARLQRANLPSAEACAEAALTGVAINRSIIAIAPKAHFFWGIYRLNPEWLSPLLRLFTA